MTGKTVAHALGLLSVDYGLLLGIMACHFCLLGFPGSSGYHLFSLVWPSHFPGEPSQLDRCTGQEEQEEAQEVRARAKGCKALSRAGFGRCILQKPKYWLSGLRHIPSTAIAKYVPEPHSWHRRFEV